MHWAIVTFLGVIFAQYYFTVLSICEDELFWLDFFRFIHRDIIRLAGHLQRDVTLDGASCLLCLTKTRMAATLFTEYSCIQLSRLFDSLSSDRIDCQQYVITDVTNASRNYGITWITYGHLLTVLHYVFIRQQFYTSL